MTNFGVGGYFRINPPCRRTACTPRDENEDAESLNLPGPPSQGGADSAIPLRRGNEPVLSLSKEGLSDKEEKDTGFPLSQE